MQQRERSKVPCKITNCLAANNLYVRLSNHVCCLLHIALHMSALRLIFFGGVLRTGSAVLRQNVAPVGSCLPRFQCGKQVQQTHLLSRYLSSSSVLKTDMSYTVEERGSPNSLEYRIFFKGPKGNVVSPFHDIPLYANSEKTVFNMVVEVPRWTNAKMEITTTEKLNPIKQDVKKGNLRYVKNCFPHHGYIWNYGALPQTWEDPSHTDENTKCNGDNDPLDVCEIGQRVAKMGDVIQVKILGTLALIDEGETDWKVLVIDVNDPLAEKLNDISDIEREMPGFIDNTFHWFKIYKVPDGKPENEFAFDSKPKDKAFALKVIEQTHGQWQKLMQGKAAAGGIACENLTVASSAHLIDAEAAQSVLDKAPAVGTANEVASSVDLWHFVVSKS